MTEAELSTEELLLIENYRKLNPKGQTDVSEFAQKLLGDSEYQSDDLIRERFKKLVDDGRIIVI